MNEIQVGPKNATFGKLLTDYLAKKNIFHKNCNIAAVPH